MSINREPIIFVHGLYDKVNLIVLKLYQTGYYMYRYATLVCEEYVCRSSQEFRRRTDEENTYILPLRFSGIPVQTAAKRKPRMGPIGMTNPARPETKHNSLFS